MGRKKNSAPEPRKSPQEIRSEIKTYIRNERDTILKKWMALEEVVEQEDNRRVQFMKKLTKDNTTIIPLNIQKFIGSIKKAIDKTMRDKGGTPFAILRQMFLYWDADKSGAMSAKELAGCMKSLGVIMTAEQLDEVVLYYDNRKGEDEMDYGKLLEHIQRGEPTLIQIPEQLAVNFDETLRFEEVQEKFKEKPMCVIQFVEATQNYVAAKMRVDGGTPYFHTHHLFQAYDYSSTNGLNPNELLLAATKGMKLAMSLEVAEAIVAYYDRKSTGQMDGELFIQDVCANIRPILHFNELTPRRIEREKQSLAVNPFIPRPFHAPANKVLEKFKRDVKLVLASKVHSMGGSVKSWIREAFVHWDPMYTRKISHVEHLIGAAKRLGLTLSTDEASCLMACYDRFGTGEMNYEILTQELMDEDPHFLADSTSVIDLSKTATSRTPTAVTACLRKLKSAVDAFSSKSKGKLQARDLLHGTFVRFDNLQTGGLDQMAVSQVCSELRARVSPAELDDLMNWFDTSGRKRLNYNDLIRQMYGEDAATKTLVLPRLGLNASGTVTMNSSFSLSNNFGNSLSSTSARGGGGVAAADQAAIIESTAAKKIRFNSKRREIMSERQLLESKLATIDQQRTQLVQAYNAQVKLKKKASLLNLNATNNNNSCIA